MSAFPIPMLSILTALPVAGALVLFALGRNKNLVRWSALAFSFAALALTLLIPHPARSNSRSATSGSLPWARSITSASMASAS